MLMTALAQAGVHIPSASREYAFVQIAAAAQPTVVPLWLIARLAGLLSQNELMRAIAGVSTQASVAAAATEVSVVAATIVSE